jgi:hypothetical protein
MYGIRLTSFHQLSKTCSLLVSWSQIQAPGSELEANFSRFERITFCICEKENGFLFRVMDEQNKSANVVVGGRQRKAFRVDVYARKF